LGSPYGLALNLDVALLSANANNAKPPPAPRGLLGGVTSTTLKLSWLPQTGVNGYFAEAVDAVTGDVVGSAFLATGGTATRFTGLVPGRVYEALVVAVTRGGAASSSPVFVTTPHS
jgi:hypothetical protein